MGHEDHKPVAVTYYCSVAGHETTVLVCPRCVMAERGRAGGKVKSAKKTEHLKRAAKRPRPGARKVKAED